MEKSISFNEWWKEEKDDDDLLDAMLYLHAININWAR